MKNKVRWNQYLTLILLIVISTACTQQKAPAKFEPPRNRILLIVGQDLCAVGGMDNYNQGYIDAVSMPGGVTSYTGIRDLGGLRQLANWGAGDICAQCYMDSPAFDDTVLVIGLYIVDDLYSINRGNLDENIISLGNWIKTQGRPIFLRIGYEFDGSWNHYDPEEYILAFQYIVDTFDTLGVTNYATVWQSSGSGPTPEYLARWYPGDDYVDWCGYTHMEHTGDAMLAFAREHGKPVMIAEATPKRDLSTGSGEEHWEQWFAPFFQHISENEDVIKAVAYINVRWMDQPMWNASWGDSRVQVNDYILKHWIDIVSRKQWRVQASDLHNS